MVKYRVISGWNGMVQDIVCGIETFADAQDIQVEKLKTFEYSKIEYYGHIHRDAA